MRQTTEQLQRRMMEKLCANFDSAAEEIIKGCRDSLVYHIEEFHYKYCLIKEFEFNPPLTERNEIVALLSKEKPLDFLYEARENSEYTADEMRYSIIETVTNEVNRLNKERVDVER